MCTCFPDFNAGVMRVSLISAFSPTPMKVPNGNYSHLIGTIPDPRCGAVFVGARYLYDHAPLTCVNFRPYNSPTIRHFFVFWGKDARVQSV